MVEPTSKLRPRDISALPRETSRDQITTILTSSYENFCTCVVAEATRPWVPRALQQVLREASWRDDWIDALTGAEANLQIAVMRARYEEGPSAGRTRSNIEALAKVRTRLHQVRASNRKKPRTRDDVDEEVRAATKALIRVYPTEFNDLLAAAFKAARVDLNARKVPAGGTDVVVRWALQLDPPAPGVPAVTSRAQEIAAMPDSAFDNLVAADIQREPEEAELCHPLLLDRWGESLERLAKATADLLGLPHRPMAAISDADLTVAGLDEETAFRRINQLRFLAHLQQRWLEQKTLGRRFRQEVTWWRDRTTGPLYEAAREELRATHRAEFEQLLQSVRAKRDETPTAAAPSTSHAASSAPQAAFVLADRLTELGWEAAIHTHVNASLDRPEARVEAARGAARLRAAYSRKKKGRNAKGWYLTFVGVRVAGESPVRLPKVADAVDLAALPEEEFAARVAEYRALQEAPTVSGS